MYFHVATKKCHLILDLQLLALSRALQMKPSCCKIKIHMYSRVHDNSRAMLNITVNYLS